MYETFWNLTLWPFFMNFCLKTLNTILSIQNVQNKGFLYLEEICIQYRDKITFWTSYTPLILWNKTLFYLMFPFPQPRNNIKKSYILKHISLNYRPFHKTLPLLKKRRSIVKERSKASFRFILSCFITCYLILNCAGWRDCVRAVWPLAVKLGGRLPGLQCGQDWASRDLWTPASLPRLQLFWCELSASGTDCFIIPYRNSVYTYALDFDF